MSKRGKADSWAQLDYLALLVYTHVGTETGALTLMSSFTTIPDEIVRWMGLRFRVPLDWEMVRHSKNSEKGSLVFVDRRRERLEVHWLDCQNEPDLERMVDNQRSLAQKEDPEARAEPLRGLGAWRALRITSRGSVVSRAVRYDAKTKRLVEVVVSSSEAEEVGEFFQWYCRHFEVEAKGSQALRWAAFDIDVSIPSGYRLCVAEIKPCDAVLEFEEVDAEGEPVLAQRVRVRRLGLVDSWFTGDSKGLIRTHAPKLKFSAFSELMYGAHPATEASGVYPAPVFTRLRGRQVRTLIRLWACAAENALYEVSSSGYRRPPIWPTDLKVHCRPYDHDPGPGEA